MDNYISERITQNTEFSSLNRLDMMVSAMWEIMIERGFDREKLNAKLVEVRENKISLEPGNSMVLCPNCGKKVTEGARTPFEGKCLYCGTVVAIYPGDHIEDEDVSPASEASEPIPDDQPLF